MRLEAIQFTEDDTVGAVPNVVTVTMTIEEACAIALFAGKVSPAKASEILGLSRTQGVGGSEADRNADAMHNVYDCLVGDVFNRYWDSGLEEYRRMR